MVKVRLVRTMIMLGFLMKLKPCTKPFLFREPQKKPIQQRQLMLVIGCNYLNAAREQNSKIVIKQKWLLVSPKGYLSPGPRRGQPPGYPEGCPYSRGILRVVARDVARDAASVVQ
jgi:hypothetical protein